MERIELTYVQTMTAIQGPGSKTQATTTQDWSCDRKDHRDAGLQMYYYPDLALVYLVYPGSSVRPVVVVPREQVRRMEPASSQLPVTPVKTKKAA